MDFMLKRVFQIENYSERFQIGQFYPRFWKIFFFCMDATEMHKTCLSDYQGSQAPYTPVPGNMHLFHNLVLNY